MTTATQVFFIILRGDVIIPRCYDIKVNDNVLDFLDLSIFTNFLRFNAL